MRNEKTTPLYERLIRSDELQGDSNSIIYKKQMLEDYAKRNGLPNPTHGYSIYGIRFDRPGEAIIVEDISRLKDQHLLHGALLSLK